MRPRFEQKRDGGLNLRRPRRHFGETLRVGRLGALREEPRRRDEERSLAFARIFFHEKRARCECFRGLRVAPSRS